MYRFIKRFFDIILSLVAIILFLPFFIPIAIAQKLTGEGYVFYLQDRVGYRNKKFRIWKFATMLKASPGLGTGSITLQNDWRVTPVGRYLRITKINEVPQIINILLGEMSIVGPRPLMRVDFEKFSPEIQAKFYNNKPGLTGIGSIIFRDEEKYISESGMEPHEFDRQFVAPYKGALELWYQEHCSLLTDTLIVFLTIAALVSPHNTLAFKIFKTLPPKPAIFAG
jgi:lipopolysaccharide/colanic/teichoic acid biosynthesis glycosyltransferase